MEENKEKDLENQNAIDDGAGACPTPKPPLPPGASPNAYWSCNKTTCEWDYNDPHVA